MDTKKDDTHKPTDRVPMLTETDGGVTHYESTTAFRATSKCGSVLATIANLVPILPSPYTTVPNGHKGLKYRGGKLIGVVDPGRHYCNPCTENLVIVPTDHLRRQSCHTKSNRTKDGIDIDCVSRANWSIRDVARYTTCFPRELDASHFMDSLVLQTVRQSIASHPSDVFLVADVKLVGELETLVRAKASDYGIHVCSLTVDDVDLTTAFKSALMTKSQTDQKNANLLSEAKAKADAHAGEVVVLAKAQADADAIRLASFQNEFKTLGSAAFYALQHQKATSMLAKSGNSKLIVFGGSSAQHEQIIARASGVDGVSAKSAE